MGTNEARIDLAGGSRVPERERLSDHEEQMLSMFNEAWDSLSAGEQAELRRERDEWLVASRRRAEHGDGIRRL